MHAHIHNTISFLIHLHILEKIKNSEWYCPSSHDPILNALKLYDYILGRLLKLKNIKLIVATALSQQPHEDNTFFVQFFDSHYCENKHKLKRIFHWIEFENLFLS